MIDWQQGFTVASICREDIKHLGYTQEQIALLTDEDMGQIAWFMEDLYCDQGYWDDLAVCISRLLQEKEQAHEQRPEQGL